MSGDIGRMALALRGGDLTAAGPLLDALRECGDHRRAERLHYAVGTLLSRLDETGASRFSAADFRREVDRLFWTELRRGDLASLSARLAAVVGVAGEAKATSPCVDGPVFRTPSTTGHAMPATTRLADEDGNELDVTDFTSAVAGMAGRPGPFDADWSVRAAVDAGLLPPGPDGDSEGGEP